MVFTVVRVTGATRMASPSSDAKRARLDEHADGGQGEVLFLIGEADDQAWVEVVAAPAVPDAPQGAADAAGNAPQALTER